MYEGISSAGFIISHELVKNTTSKMYNNRTFLIKSIKLVIQNNSTLTTIRQKYCKIFMKLIIENFICKYEISKEIFIFTKINI